MVAGYQPFLRNLPRSDDNPTLKRWAIVTISLREKGFALLGRPKILVSLTVPGRSNFGIGEDLCNFPAAAVFDVAVLEHEHTPSEVSLPPSPVAATCVLVSAFAFSSRALVERCCARDGHAPVSSFLPEPGKQTTRARHIILVGLPMNASQVRFLIRRLHQHTCQVNQQQRK